MATGSLAFLVLPSCKLVICVFEAVKHTCPVGHGCDASCILQAKGEGKVRIGRRFILSCKAARRQVGGQCLITSISAMAIAAASTVETSIGSGCFSYALQGLLPNHCSVTSLVVSNDGAMISLVLGDSQQMFRLVRATALKVPHIARKLSVNVAMKVQRHRGGLLTQVHSLCRMKMLCVAICSISVSRYRCRVPMMKSADSASPQTEAASVWQELSGQIAIRNQR